MHLNISCPLRGDHASVTLCTDRGHRVSAGPARSACTKAQLREPVATTARYELLEVNGNRVTNLISPSGGGPIPARSSALRSGVGSATETALPSFRPQGVKVLGPVLQAKDRFLKALKDLYLPPGYPASITPDYVPYQMWSIPTHVTGHLSHSLSTSSLLSAVGVSAGPVGTVAVSAGIRWVIKDGIGALGRLLAGTRFTTEFDEDPKRWRMVAECVTTVGLALEVATSAFPQHFLFLASSGNFCKALGKGMGKPVFRVIQTHFAAANNVGAVAAKEEVWEVTAQMTGLACSVALLRSLQSAGAAKGRGGDCFVADRRVHVLLRYQALATLRFDYLNQKRACMLASAAVAGRPLPCREVANAEEPMLLSAQPQLLQEYAQLYDKEGYMLVWRDRTAHVVLKSGEYDSQRVLRAVWQAAWLDHHHAEPRLHNNEHHSSHHAHHPVQGQGHGLTGLAASLKALDGGFSVFQEALVGDGWDLATSHIKLGPARLQVSRAAVEDQ